MNSIFNTVKSLLGIALDDTTFDPELLIHTNATLMVINQLGVGDRGFHIAGATETWDDFTKGRKDLELIKTNVYFRVRLAFDPPQNSFLVQSMEKQIAESDWRIEIYHNEEEE